MIAWPPPKPVCPVSLPLLLQLRAGSPGLANVMGSPGRVGSMPSRIRATWAPSMGEPSTPTCNATMLARAPWNSGEARTLRASPTMALMAVGCAVFSPLSNLDKSAFKALVSADVAAQMTGG